jgi:DegV family protein with EDD domain
MDSEAFMARLRAGKDMPKSAAPYPGDFIDVFQQCVSAGESVVCIHPSAELSGTVRSAEIAKKDFPGADVRIIDTRTVAGPLGALVLEADRLAKQGANADEVEGRVRELMARARIYFIVDTLEFLRRGGRIGGAQALMGTVLQIKPILTLVNGRIDQFERERTKKKALARLYELVLAESAQGVDAHVSVNHADAGQEAEELAGDLKRGLGTDAVLILDMPPAIVTHAGPGLLAVGFFTPK